MTSTQTRKLLLWIVKIATLIISAPATTIVTIKITRINLPFDKSIIFNFLEVVIYVIVVVATLLVVELSFLYLWQLVEDKYQTSKDETEVSVYVVGVWLMYVVLIVLGFLATGALDKFPFVYDLVATICFRFTVGLMLFYATYNTLFRTRQRISEMVASGQHTSRKVISRKKLANENVDIAKIEAVEKATLKAVNDAEETLNKLAASQLAKELLATKTNGHTKKSDIVISEVAEDEVDDKVVVSNLEYDHPNFTVVPVDNGWLMKCKHCDEQKVKDTRVNAIRTGASHGKKHNNEMKELPSPVEESSQLPPADYVPVPPTADPQPESRFQDATNTGEF